MQYSFEDYNNINFKSSKSMLTNVVLLIIIIGIIFIICTYKFNIYEKHLLYLENGKYYLLIDLDKQNTIQNKDKIIIDGINYNYEIIDDNINYITLEDKIYKAISIEISDFNWKDKYTYIQILSKSKTLLNIIVEFMDGGKHE